MATCPAGYKWVEDTAQDLQKTVSDVTGWTPPTTSTNNSGSSSSSSSTSTDEYGSLKELLKLKNQQNLETAERSFKYRMLEKEPELELERAKLGSAEKIAKGEQGVNRYTTDVTERISQGQQGVDRESIRSSERISSMQDASRRYTTDVETGSREKITGMETGSQERQQSANLAAQERMQGQDLGFKRESQASEQSFKERFQGMEQAGELERQTGRLASQERMQERQIGADLGLQANELGEKRRSQDSEQNFRLSEQASEQGWKAGEAARGRAAQIDMANLTSQNRRGEMTHEFGLKEGLKGQEFGYEKELFGMQQQADISMMEEDQRQRQRKMDDARQAASNLAQKGHFRRETA